MKFVFLTMLATAGVFGSAGVVIEPLQAEFGRSNADISFALAVRLLLFGLMGPFSAALMNRFGIRNVVIAALDYIDIFQLHGFDARTPIEETLSALDDLVRAGKIRYVGCSNFSGWHLMKSLSVAERYNFSRHVSHQAYYSLANREYESELMPLGLDQGVSAIVWSPLASGRLTGKIRRGVSVPQRSRRGLRPGDGPFVEDSHPFKIIDAIDEIASEPGKSVTTIALTWFLQRPTVASLIIGARNETQLSENFGAIGWALTPDQVQRLDKASRVIPTYPYWHQKGFAERHPFPTLHRST